MENSPIRLQFSEADAFAYAFFYISDNMVYDKM